jgi:hypothetical protein
MHVAPLNLLEQGEFLRSSGNFLRDEAAGRNLDQIWPKPLALNPSQQIAVSFETEDSGLGGLHTRVARPTFSFGRHH